jgi:succinate dehydrogenase / fumarate reductase membrane anchor subunit
MKETEYWVWHMFAGVMILILLGIHMITMHLGSLLGWFNPAGGDPTDWANLVARARQITYVILYVLLLAAALYHGLYGFRTILFELGLKAGSQRLVNILFVVAGISLFGLGAWVVAKFHFIAQAT